MGMTLSKSINGMRSDIPQDEIKEHDKKKKAVLSEMERIAQERSVGAGPQV